MTAHLTIRTLFALLLFGMLSVDVCTAGLTIDIPVLKDSISQDSLNTARKRVLDDAKVKSQSRDDIQIIIRNVDIANFPRIDIIAEAFAKDGQPLDTLLASDLVVREDGDEKEVISVTKISVDERVPVDFVFVIDVTGTMQEYIDAVKSNIIHFTSSLMRRGIDYRLGLVLFSDIVPRSYEPSGSVVEYLSWMNKVRTTGGGDLKENALEGLATAANMKFRPSANKVVVLITDYNYHQAGEKGQGRTRHTTKSIIDLYKKQEIRAFTITPEHFPEYKEISEETRGANFDIKDAFGKILDNFSSQLTNLYAIQYVSSTRALPDSIEVGILNSRRVELVSKVIPILEIDRKLILKNLLFALNSTELTDSIPELDMIADFMDRKKKVKIQVEGHTDAIGRAAYNMKLSEQRAEAVKKYLVDRGVLPSRIKVKGFGESMPIAPNNTEKGRSLNRRTEIVIVEK